MNKQAQSLLDYLLQVMPELKDQKFKLMIRPQGKDPNAKSLYGLWSDAANKIGERKFRRPPTMSDKDVKSLESSGMIEIQGKDLKVTSHGVLVLRKMILDDDAFHLGKKSECEDCRVKTASVEKPIFFSPISRPQNWNMPKKSNNWYKRFKDANASA
jgi:hypothetical protein